ncbi:diaminopimelate epimerase [Tepidimicrobium xylanilyticum]|uniref:Diaminopimelate epimerase n=1 Tax=Tepidimicrobium xylanilyticum TaxID=1123352 RepID=A0A1H3E1V3_9FIRM|nr:diaminopimelate epimerase [Tepidimicrobium xylanilyticum]GMG97052.1 diaminopimelate epimerase [Tepidimicrobium xylanilyticum]SDX72702.1 Diaminopimelate epimerase [Tepidimicrobium xylanilyticum]
MKLRYVKVNPVENMTIFVLDPVPRKFHMKIANKLMSYNNIHGEQVGFIEREQDLIRLQMMGGEFCGNASRSLAAFIVYSQYPNIKKIDQVYEVTIKTSGIEGIITCKVTPTEKGNSFFSEINMPLPLLIKEFHFKEGNNSIKSIKVSLPGIIHFIVDANKVQDKDSFFKVIKNEMDKEEYDAFGIMYYDRESNFLTPLVYVKNTDSLFWERSCASGTAALGAALAYESESSISKEIQQPGGSLEISIDWKSNNIDSIKLDGLVEIVSEGIAYL